MKSISHEIKTEIREIMNEFAFACGGIPSYKIMAKLPRQPADTSLMFKRMAGSVVKMEALFLEYSDSKIGYFCFEVGDEIKGIEGRAGVNRLKNGDVVSVSVGGKVEIEHLLILGSSGEHALSVLKRRVLEPDTVIKFVDRGVFSVSDGK